MDALRRLALRGGDGPPDADLLAEFVERGDPAAFEALVRRHGPMVLAVCRRVLGHDADAEDAFQATFLVLARKAGQVAPRSAVGNWLYGVAVTTARKARRTDRRRRARERRVAVPAGKEAAPPDDRARLWAVLDEELARLPAVYREAVVLCELEGRTLQQAADQLGCPVGTVASRLARGRSLLAGRLAGRGVTLPAVLGPAVQLPASLVQATVTGTGSGAVLTLAEGVLKVMFLNRLPSAVGAAVLVVAVVTGLSAFGQLERPAVPPASGPIEMPPAAPIDPVRAALAREVRYPGSDDRKVTLGDVLAEFKQRYGLAITLDEKAFEAEGLHAGLELDTLLDLRIAANRPLGLEETQLYHVLRKVVLPRIPSPSGAALIVRRNGVEITTRAALLAANRQPEPPPAPSRERIQQLRHTELFLNTPVDFPGLDDRKTTLDEALDFVGKRYGIRFEVNGRAFGEEQVMEVLKTEIAQQRPIPPLRGATGAMVLEAVLAPCANPVVPSRAVFRLLPTGDIEITTGAALKAEAGVGPRP